MGCVIFGTFSAVACWCRAVCQVANFLFPKGRTVSGALRHPTNKQRTAAWASLAESAVDRCKPTEVRHLPH